MSLLVSDSQSQFRLRECVPQTGRANGDISAALFSDSDRFSTNLVQVAHDCSGSGDVRYSVN